MRFGSNKFRSSIALAYVAVGFLGGAGHQAGIDRPRGLPRTVVTAAQQSPAEQAPAAGAARAGAEVPGVDELIAGMTVVGPSPRSPDTTETAARETAAQDWGERRAVFADDTTSNVIASEEK